MITQLQHGCKYKDLYGNPGNRFKKIGITQQFSIKKALPYFRGVFLASGVVILLIYRDLRDFFNSRGMFKKALPYFRGVFRASGVVILLFYRDLRDFFNSRVQQVST